MSVFAVYDAMTGGLKRWGTCGEHDVSNQAQAGEGVADITDLSGWDGDDRNWTWNGASIIPVVFTDAQLLAAARAARSQILQSDYQIAILAPVTFTTAAGTTATFSQDAASKSNLQDALSGSGKTEAWSLGIWLDVTGAVVSPFVYADLQGLAAAMEAYDTPKYSELLTLLSQVAAATTVEAVQAISWS